MTFKITSKVEIDNTGKVIGTVSLEGEGKLIDTDIETIHKINGKETIIFKGAMDGSKAQIQVKNKVEPQEDENVDEIKPNLSVEPVSSEVDKKLEQKIRNDIMVA